jgi:hypothetical protein
MGDDFYIRNPLRVGMCGDDVRYIQEVLNTQGFDVPVSGVFDAETMTAARKELTDFYLERYDEWPPDYRTEYSGAMSRYNPESPDFSERERDEVFLGDQEAYEKWGLLQESWRFSSRDEFEEFLQATPSPIPDFLYMFDAQRLQREIPYTELPEPMKDAKNSLPEVKNTDIAPPSSEPYCSIPMSDAGTGSSITNLALYEEVRKQLPAEIGDDRAAEATLRALQDGIRTPEKLQDVVVANDRIFVIGTVPGFRGVVDLNQPPLPSTDIHTQFAAFEQRQQTERDQPQHVRAGLSLG